MFPFSATPSLTTTLYFGHLETYALDNVCVRNLLEDCIVILNHGYGDEHRKSFKIMIIEIYLAAIRTARRHLSRLQRP
jgi:hypothetical protein